ncbi:MAG TPA: signal peptidase II [Ignavibacteria bacterium]
MRVIFLTFFLVIIDQVSKLFIKGLNIPFLGISHKGMDYGSSINIIGNFFRLTYIENPGMAFGIELGGKLFLSLFTIFATILIIYFIYKNRNQSLYLRISLAFILGGAIGNMIDRTFYGIAYGYAPLFYGKVVDFFHFDIPDFRIFSKTVYTWPIFNFADIWVSLGFLLIVIGYKWIFKKEASHIGGLQTDSSLLENSSIPADTNQQNFTNNQNQTSTEIKD